LVFFNCCSSFPASKLSISWRCLFSTSGVSDGDPLD
jgi:hypothetical protein